MQLTWTLALALAVLVAGGRGEVVDMQAPAAAFPRDDVLIDGGDLISLFETFVESFGKTYASEADQLEHFATFVRNVGAMEQHNQEFLAGERSFFLGINEFADLTNLEYRARRAPYVKDREIWADQTHKALPNERLPAHVDWRTKHVVSRVKNQAQCGSCWSFSATGSMEGAHAVATGKLVELSEQQLVDCVDHGEDNCSRGGEMAHGFKYAIKKGADAERAYPYESTSGHECRSSQHQPVAKFASYSNVTQYDERSLQSALAKYPTVAVAIDASSFEFQTYGGGVYNNPSCKSGDDELDHGVLAVGYGTTSDGEDYWIVKNSWGPSWGDRGYILMSRNKDNQCGIATDASFIHSMEERVVFADRNPNDISVQ